MSVQWPFTQERKTQLVQYLDDYIVGQKNAKKVLSVAYVLIYLLHDIMPVEWTYSVYNHYNRVRANMSHRNEEDRLTRWDDEARNGSPNPQLVSSLIHRVAVESLPAIQLQPHPFRLASGQGADSAFSLAPQPLFEKSNVLLVYVKSIPLFQLRSLTCGSGPTGSGF